MSATLRWQRCSQAGNHIEVTNSGIKNENVFPELNGNLATASKTFNPPLYACQKCPTKCI